MHAAPGNFYKLLDSLKCNFLHSLDRNWLTRKVLCSEKMKYYDLAIIIVSFQLFIFYSINKCKKISHFFHTSKINYYFVCEPQMLRVKQPDITMSGVRLETKPMSVHVLTVH